MRNYDLSLLYSNDFHVVAVPPRAHVLSSLPPVPMPTIYDKSQSLPPEHITSELPKSKSVSPEPETPTDNMPTVTPLPSPTTNSPSVASSYDS